MKLQNRTEVQNMEGKNMNFFHLILWGEDEKKKSIFLWFGVWIDERKRGGAGKPPGTDQDPGGEGVGGTAVG